MVDETTTAQLRKTTIEKLRTKGVTGETVDSIIMRLIEQVDNPKTEATLDVRGLRKFFVDLVKEYVTEVEARIAKIESIYKDVVIPQHDFEKRERERRLTHGQTHKCVCIDCGTEVEVGDDVSCSDAECEECGKAMTDKTVEKTKEGKDISKMSPNEIRACDTITPEEKKKILAERMREFILA